MSLNVEETLRLQGLYSFEQIRSVMTTNELFELAFECLDRVGDLLHRVAEVSHLASVYIPLFRSGYRNPQSEECKRAVDAFLERYHRTTTHLEGEEATRSAAEALAVVALAISSLQSDIDIAAKDYQARSTLSSAFNLYRHARTRKVRYILEKIPVEREEVEWIRGQAVRILEKRGVVE